MIRFFLLFFCACSFVATAQASDAKDMDEQTVFHQFMEIALPRDQCETLVGKQAYTYSESMIKLVQENALESVGEEDLKAMQRFFFKKYMNEFPYDKIIDFMFERQLESMHEQGFFYDSKALKKVIAFAKTKEGNEILNIFQSANNSGQNIVLAISTFNEARIDYPDGDFSKAFPHIQLKSK